ncbi:metallophosphoesterase [Lacticaseibacillus paracasei]|uniref:metallophosphoesterase family protein n=1 Tax=Lacticaseibacillus paracasei TaxID=1597 RepID=UPI00115BF680|nr:metallophosphoesterase family protein [Lacticaseibacillus paracasei]MCT3350053.1 metallophosphoesterase [Lacticaseibacillus paracasei]QPB57805.1 metallophosphoesterase [Lacticaseibacillus paracasei]WPQ30122.1 metallophosphoesterase family protein [Lacticaseibacillus paracasei]VTZ82514.1 hypothetical protein LPCP272_00448 [Lacticaseibacillus paracasei]
MTKIAIFSDVHGNLTALNAVYADAQRLDADDYWFLGDLFGPGPDTQTIWEKLIRINPSVNIRGNWEDFLITAMSRRDELSNSLQEIESYVIQHLAYPRELCHLLSDWPLHQEVTINGVRIGLSHHLPDSNSGDALSVRAEGSDLQALFMNSRQKLDLAIYAHIHHPTMRYIDLNASLQKGAQFDYAKADERLILNPGSVGLPFDTPTRGYKERRAEYLLLEVGTSGELDPQFRRVPYDLTKTFESAEKQRLPFRESYINGFHV